MSTFYCAMRTLSNWTLSTNPEGREYIITPISPRRKQAWGMKAIAPGYRAWELRARMCNWAAWLHQAVCHYQTLLICSNAFLKLLVRLNIFPMYLLTTCISSSCGSISDIHLALSSQELGEYKLSKYLPKARQAPLRAYISHGGNSRSLGWNTSRCLQSYAPNQSILLTFLTHDSKTVLIWAPLCQELANLSLPDPSERWIL